LNNEVQSTSNFVEETDLYYLLTEP